MKRETALAATLLSLGLALRLWATGHARITGDESHFWFVARRVATFQYFPVYGPEITGTPASHPGGLFYYAMAIPQLFGSSPRLGAAFVAILHVVAGWLVYRLLLEARGSGAAIAGLAVAMASPWDVLYADRIWVSCLVPVLGTVGLYAATRARDSAAWQGALAGLLLVLPQVHLSAPVLWIACAVIVLLRPPARWNRRALWIGVAIAFVLYAPMLVVEVQSGFRNTRAILEKAGGHEPLANVLKTPFEVLGYAILYGSAELSYHFDRGYWGGYDDVARYLTAPGWARAWTRDGPIAGSLGILSVLTAIALWISTAIGLGPRIVGAVKRRERSALDLGDVILVSLAAGLMAAAALMMASKKTWFPHYANVLMPMLVFPIGAGFARAVRIRTVVAGALAASAGIMTVNTIRYYREIDGLNGLSATIAMVGDAVAEQPVGLSFDHFDNRFAWSRIAIGIYGKDLKTEAGARIHYRVRNRQRHEGPVPDGARLYGAVLVERSERTRPRPEGLVFRAMDRWREIEVLGLVRCRAATGDECRYGPEPWQQMRPHGLEVRGRGEPLLFLHPIAKTPVVATIPIPSGAVRGKLHYALSDAAHRSENRSPITIRLRQGERTLVAAETGRSPGIETKAFVLTSTGAPTLELEIVTENDGARVFGFDLDLTE
jgi:hypothetical protein